MAERAVGAVVSGHVQGVGFRYATRRAARALGVSGWVANAPDGTVRVFAQGDPESIVRFLAFLGEGPTSATVDRLDVTEDAPRPDLPGFDVRG